MGRGAVHEARRTGREASRSGRTFVNRPHPRERRGLSRHVRLMPALASCCTTGLHRRGLHTTPKASSSPASIRPIFSSLHHQPTAHCSQPKAPLQPAPLPAWLLQETPSLLSRQPSRRSGSISTTPERCGGAGASSQSDCGSLVPAVVRRQWSGGGPARASWRHWGCRARG
jgi:hypothetical protein